MLNDTHRAGWYWLVGALVLGMPAVGSGQGTVADDRAALEALYDATNGANWSRNDNWLTSEPLGNWYGVGTDSAGRVTTLYLWDNGLAGSIPAEFGNLINLTYLDLGHDELTGSIPAEFGNLINLQELFLWNESGFRSQLTGSIPAEFGNLTNLQNLSLNGHQLTGSIPAELGNLTNLQGLWLSTNQLTGSIPAELESLINLRWLTLYDNNLNGPLPSSMTNLRQLEELSIYNNAGLCAPADAAVQAWLATIDDFRGNTCAAPQPVGTLAPLTIGVDELSVTVEVSGAFLDPNGDTLTYRATSSAPGVATVVVFGSAVVVTPVVEGTATVTVTATDAGGSNATATQMFLVTVGPAANRPPASVGVLPPVTLGVDDAAVRVEVGGAFRDPDGDALTYRATSSAPSVASVAVVGSTVTVAPVSEGTATVTVTATDAGGSNGTATQTFSVTVGPAANRPPVAVGTLPAVRLPDLDATLEVDVFGAFDDLDGDALTYAVSSSAPQVVTVWAAGARVTLTAVALGRSVIEVRATDADGLSAAQSFPVRVAAPFTDDPLQPGVTPIKAVHFTDLRTRINVLRGEVELQPFRWTDPVLRAGVTRVRLLHLLELRSALAEAYVAAGRAVPRWTDASPAAGSTPIRAAHLTELRAAVLALE